jgi:NAD(P)-dependent dehydrogenase (short-subunit alcohol dehydrogenase family)
VLTMNTAMRMLPRLAHRPVKEFSRPATRLSVAATPRSLRRTLSSTVPRCSPSVSIGTQTGTSSSTTTQLGSLPEFDLTNHTILVTGAARGLGLCMAEALLDAGATVYALDRLPPTSQHPSFTTIQSQHDGRLQYRQIDVRDVPALNDTVASIAESTGRMDGLIAAAGIQQETAAIEYSQEDAQRMFETNVVGVMMTAQAVAKQMIKLDKGGSMAFIASMSGTVANRGLPCSAYNSSKAAVVQLARNLAAEWGEKGIRVNTISPGYIVTAMVEELFRKHPERREIWASQNMLGRVSMPEDYRAIAVYLMGGGSRFMTATDIRLDGGHCAW